MLMFEIIHSCQLHNSIATLRYTHMVVLRVSVHTQQKEGRQETDTLTTPSFSD